MEIRLAFDHKGLTLDVPDSMITDRFGLSTVDRPVTYTEFATELAASGGEQFLSGELPLFVVNDGFRNTPTRHLLEWLDTFDDTILDRAHFLIATGAHSAPTPEHLSTIFGPYLDRVHDRVGWHDARVLGDMDKIGIDHFGGEVFLNRQALEVEKLFVVGSVEPHYFAGFTGGRKSLFPGLTDLATIERNHNLANSLEAAPLKLKGNPVSEHFDELLGLCDLNRILTAQVVMDAGGRIERICFGRLDKAFADATEAAVRLYSHEVEQKYDIVVAEIRPPLDKNLYQAQKALENTQTAVVDGGSVILVTPCNEGVGSKYFFDLANSWDRETNLPEDGIARFGSHKLSRVNAMTRRINVRIISSLPEDHARRVFYEPLDDINEYLAQHEKETHGLRLAVVHDAGHTVLHTT